MVIAAALIFGLLIGSFLNVCIFRIPRGQSYTYTDEELDRMGDIIPPPPPFNEPKRSHCPQCKQQLLWWHNIPVVSWFLLRGRCAFCGSHISLRYASVELLTGLVAVLTTWFYGVTLEGAIVFSVSCALIVITYIDYDYFIIPDLISLNGTKIGIVIALVNQFFSVFETPVVSGILDCILGMAAGGGFLYLVSEVYLKVRKIEGLGLGDVKLLLFVGAVFGAECALYTIFLGSVIGSVFGITMVLVSRRNMDQHLPFGPYLAMGTFLFLFGRHLAAQLGFVT